MVPALVALTLCVGQLRPRQWILGVVRRLASWRPAAPIVIIIGVRLLLLQLLRVIVVLLVLLLLLLLLLQLRLRCGRDVASGAQ